MSTIISPTPALDAVTGRPPNTPPQIPAARPVTPAVASTVPHGAPAPVLQQQGFFGGVGEFVQRVHAIVDAHQKAYNHPPSPQLTLDLARSQVPAFHFPSLFSVPQTPEAAQARGSLVNAHANGDTLIQRHDGLVEPANPLRNVIYGPPAPAQQPQNQPVKTLKQFQGLQATHPWVAAGMLPLPTEMLHALWSAVDYSSKNPGAVKPLTVGGETVQQYRAQSAVAAEGQGINSVTGAVEDPALVQKLATRPGESINAVTTIREAQDRLKQIAPVFFDNLPSSGTINQDWSNAIRKYTTTPAYFRQQTQQLAHDNHFGSDTGSFVKAWTKKNEAIRKHPAFALWLRAQPLTMFAANTNAGFTPTLHMLTGDTKGWGWVNIPTVALGSLVHTAGFALTEIAGTLNQAKVDAAAASAYVHAIEGKNQELFGFYGPRGGGKTEAEARREAFKVLQENPSWARILDPTLPEHPRGRVAALAVAANFAYDLLLGAPKFTGEKVLAGDVASVAGSRYVASKSTFAYNSLRRGDVGGATSSLEGGLGAERLNVAAEDAVKSGEMTLAEYQRHIHELYANGTTTVGDTAVDGDLLGSLRTRYLPTPGPKRTALNEARARLAKVTDDFENTLRTSKQLGATNHAANYVSSVRQVFARAAPGAEKRYIYDERLPEDVYNWARVNLKDQQVAAELRDQLIRLRAKDDIQGVSALGERMRTLYAEAHPGSDIKANPVESSGPELESESRSFLTFPKSLETTAQSINAGLNKAGRVHREVIVGGSPNPFIVPLIPGFGESLMFKHIVADTTRRVVGGGGGLFGIKGDLARVRSEVESHLRANPETVRDVGVARAAAKMGENRWITGYRTTAPESYRTGEHLGDTSRMTAAGGYLRHNLSSKALKAYQLSTPQDMGPLINLVLKDKTFHALAFSDDAYAKKLADLRGATATWTAPQRDAIIRELNRDHAQSYAELLYRRYKEIDEAGRAAGLADPLNSALDVLVTHAGPKADVALGKWINKNKLDFPVRDGLVEQKQWDDTMQKWIGVLMTANKWNRGSMFDHVFYSTVRDLRGAGWDMDHALPVAAALAKKQTVYHMLDFSNMLQVEQNLRWLSYFATKHRLYWTWILRQMRARPGLTVAIADAKTQLDSTGNLNFNIDGHELTVPAARLFWVNAKEYPQTSPIVQFGGEFGKGMVEGHGTTGAVSDAFGSLTSTSGNLITRDDQAEALAAKLVLLKMGKLPATSDAVTFGMSPVQKRQFQENVNRYSAAYRQEFGHWPTEQGAVTWSLLHGTAQEFWRTNLFFPLLVGDASVTPPKVKAEMDEYARIVNPKKKRLFLDQHPDVALRFGVSQDPAVYLHNNVLWDRYNTAHAELERQRDRIYQSILKNGFTVETKRQMSVLSAWWSKQVDGLKLQDAATWAGNTDFPKGVVSDGQVVTAGPWGIGLEGDPLAARAFVHQLFPGIGKAQLDAHTVGETVVQLQAESARLRSVGTDLAKAKALGYPDLQHVHDRLSQISTIIAPFFSYPKDAPSRLQSDYYTKFVGPYIKERDAMQQKIALAPSDQQDALRSEFRAWKDDHDHPVSVEWKGRKVEFPSVVQIGWATLPTLARQQALAFAASDDWAHVAAYEKTMLGVPTPARVGEGWAAYADAIRAYEKNPSNPGISSAQKRSMAKQIDKQAPGFYKDWLFQQKPKLERWQATTLYKSLPERQWFDANVAATAEKFIAAIKANGHRSYYEKAWRNAVEETIMPAINTSPDLVPLKRALVDYGPDFLNTLVSVNG